MNTKWKVTKLMAAGSMGVLSLAVMLLGGGITATTGNIILGGLINGFITPATVMITMFVVDKFGSAAIMFLVFGVLSIPFDLAGPPGWLIKVPIRFVGGIIADFLFTLLKSKERMASVIIGILLQAYTGVTVFGLALLLNVPGMEQTARTFFSIAGIAASIIFGGAGGILGWYIYSRIKNTAIVKRIQKN